MGHREPNRSLQMNRLMSSRNIDQSKFIKASRKSLTIFEEFVEYASNWSKKKTNRCRYATGWTWKHSDLDWVCPEISLDIRLHRALTTFCNSIDRASSSCNHGSHTFLNIVEINKLSTFDIGFVGLVLRKRNERGLPERVSSPSHEWT
jgi:hypothetical protein